MHSKIIPFGYANGGMTALEQLMQEECAYLVDIRYSPRSRIPAFNRTSLQARFPGRYVHIPELGNVNYKNGQSISDCRS